MIIELSKEEIQELIIKHVENTTRVKIGNNHWKDYNDPSGYVIEVTK